MKIWFDILTPKQVLFFEPMIKKLRKKHSVLCTSRNYREAIQLAKIRNLKVRVIGKHGGVERYSKLNESLKRMVDLSKIVKKYSPDLTISLCSPEASRISYGLGIKHIAFSNSPHHEKVMKFFEEYLAFGGFPQVVLADDESKKKLFLKDIFTSYFEMDVRKMADFRQMSAFRDMLLLLMQRVGSKLEISKLSSEIGVSRETVYSYLSFLEGSYFIF